MQGRMPHYYHSGMIRTSAFFSRGFADSRKNWGLGLALERILAGWQAAAVSGVHKVGRLCCPS
jgi:hypothetical protein